MAITPVMATTDTTTTMMIMGFVFDIYRSTSLEGDRGRNRRG
jgi:hypothetical protein